MAKTDGATKDSLRILDRNYVNDSEDFSLTLGATPSLLASTSVHFHPKSMIEDTSGLISEIIDVNISAESDFNSAELVFDYSDIDLKDIDENDLTFLYLNEETGMYEKVESYVDNVNKTVTCYPSHFSRYVVGDILCVLKQFNFDKSTIVVDGQTIEAYEIAHSEFDVKKDGFAFHNFQIEGIEGFCYGFTLVSFLNYIEKMPISREGYDKLLTKNIPSYDLSIMERFSNKLLYDSSERDLFNSGNNYMLYTPSMSTDTKMTTNCITYWFFEQHNVLDHAGVNVMDPLGYLYIKESLENDKPVPLTLYTTFHRKAHSVLAYGFYSTLSADYILVYDCNYPGELRYIELKKCLSNYIKSTYGSYSDIRIAVVDIPEGPYVEYSNNGTLSGRVCRAADRTTPVSGATVEIYKDNVLYKTVTSDSNGNYLISLPEGSYSVKTTCRSYLDFKSSETVRADETTYVETFLLIEGNTTDSGKAKGKVFNSLSGQGVADVTLTVKKDWNSTSSAETVKTTVTNGSGEYTIELPIGNYTVIATKEGHSPSSFNIIVQKGTTDNQNGVITPVITGEDYLITLTWGENPEDLDSHVAGYLSNDSLFHVYYNNDKQTDGQNTVCELDYDDRYSYGPEHITLKTNNDSPYYYFVKKYKGTGSLSESGAKVTIEQGNILIAEFYVPTNLGKEDCWNVFAIKNGELIIRNTISTDPDIEYAD